MLFSNNHQNKNIEKSKNDLNQIMHFLLAGMEELKVVQDLVPYREVEVVVRVGLWVVLLDVIQWIYFILTTLFICQTMIPTVRDIL